MVNTANQEDTIRNDLLRTIANRISDNQKTDENVEYSVIQDGADIFIAIEDEGRLRTFAIRFYETGKLKKEENKSK